MPKYCGLCRDGRHRYLCLAAIFPREIANYSQRTASEDPRGCALNFIGFEIKPQDRRQMEFIVRVTMANS